MRRARLFEDLRGCSPSAQRPRRPAAAQQSHGTSCCSYNAVWHRPHVVRAVVAQSTCRSMDRSACAGNPETDATASGKAATFHSGTGGQEQTRPCHTWRLAAGSGVCKGRACTSPTCRFAERDGAGGRPQRTGRRRRRASRRDCPACATQATVGRNNLSQARSTCVWLAARPAQYQLHGSRRCSRSAAGRSPR